MRITGEAAWSMAGFAVAGALIALFRPFGMARVLFATALAQVFVIVLR
jgi:hypothetical protein